MLREIAPQIWRFTPAQSTQAHVAVVAGLHGNETGPVKVLEQICDPEHPLWRHCDRRVTLAIAHPQAVAAGLRNPIGGADLNRSFGQKSPTRTEEAARVALLKTHLQGADTLLDLHQTVLPISPCAVCPPTPEHLQLAQELGAHQAVTGAQSQFLGGMLIDWANQQGSRAITLETGQIGDPEALRVSEAAVAVLLGEAPPKTHPLQVWQLAAPLHAPDSTYEWAEAWENGSRIEPGQTIANSPSGPLLATVRGALFLPKLGVSKGEVCALQATAASK